MAASARVARWRPSHVLIAICGQCREKICVSVRACRSGHWQPWLSVCVCVCVCVRISVATIAGNIAAVGCPTHTDTQTRTRAHSHEQHKKRLTGHLTSNLKQSRRNCRPIESVLVLPILHRSLLLLCILRLLLPLLLNTLPIDATPKWWPPIWTFAASQSWWSAWRSSTKKWRSTTSASSPTPSPTLIGPPTLSSRNWISTILITAGATWHFRLCFLLARLHNGYF